MAITELQAESACATPAPISPDSQILTAFEQWKTLHAQRRALPIDDDEAEFAIWDQIDAADHQVHDLPAITPAGLACKLWIAITHNTEDAEPEYAALRTDLDWFVAQGGAINWNVRCIVSALVALKTMEG